MNATARLEILNVVDFLLKGAKARIIYVPALYCKEVTDRLIEREYDVRYYDFPYISEIQLDEAERLGAVVITVLYPPPYEIRLSKIAKRTYDKEVFDCVLVNPKFRDKYLNYFGNNASVWSLRKFYGIPYAFMLPQDCAGSLPIKLRTKFYLHYIVTMVRRQILGRVIETKIQNSLSLINKCLPSVKEDPKPFVRAKSVLYDISFIDYMESHFSRNSNNSEFWFEFSSDSNDGKAWPGVSNCLNEQDIKSYELASHVNSKLVARYKLYRDQK